MYTGIALLAVLVIAYAARRRILRAIGGFLVVQDERQPCDAIVVLNGNISTRAYRAAELYKANPAPVLIARLADTEEVRLGVIPNISDATRTLMARLGVAETDIEVLDSDRWVAGTWAEAILICTHIRDRGYRRVAIVTDAFHTRRARWTFRRVMREGSVEFLCMTTRYSLDLAGQWWRSEYGLVQVVAEYLKFLHYRRLDRAARRGPPPVVNDLPLADGTRACVTGRDEK